MTSFFTGGTQTFINGLPLYDLIVYSNNLKEILSLSNLNFYTNLAYFLLVLFISSNLADFGLGIFFEIERKDKAAKKLYPYTKAAFSIVGCIIAEEVFKPLKYENSAVMKTLSNYTGNIDAKSLISLGLLAISIFIIIRLRDDLLCVVIVLIIMTLIANKLNRKTITLNEAFFIKNLTVYLGG